jgi:hypothetical protein
MSIGWVDLSHILDLFREGRKLEWLTTHDLNNLLVDNENYITFKTRIKEYNTLTRMLHKRNRLATIDEKLKVISI